MILVAHTKGRYVTCNAACDKGYFVLRALQLYKKAINARWMYSDSGDKLWAQHSKSCLVSPTMLIVIFNPTLSDNCCY